ncbi:methylesterase 3-like [Phalaenopsis equestris]|uniref:methylesterase 3-like n=1 Tax=Phalaenopsis equestris TaxID=78828 RepID=UPI0009E3DD1B|nr:methylesterase 3-like [Phalaenopsis equestris]
MKIILVHGGGHGAWCWYKVVAMVRSQGSVTAVDLAASGSDPRRIPEDVSSFDEYSQPLMDLMASVAEGEKVVLVGHSFGGISLATAMEAFPEKIAVAVFVSALLPDIVHPPFYILEQHFEQLPDKYTDMQTKSIAIPGRSEPFIISILQPKLLASSLYQNCSFEIKSREKKRLSNQIEMKIILVHGGGHGAWCWYKVVAMLRSQGYSVTAVDLAACGSDPRRIPEDVSNFDEYSQPLMDLMASVGEGEKVVLVGHSFGGLNLAAAMDAFPEKIAVAVFVAAVLPDTVHSPWYIFEKQNFEELLDKYTDGVEVKSVVIPGRSEPFIIFTLLPTLLASAFYQNCSIEDLTLGNMMVRPVSIFKEDLKNRAAFTKERYGSVDKVFIVCGEDAMVTLDFQRWMIQNSPVKEVMEIKEADHMAMLSKPEELCQCLTTIVSKYVW